MKTQAWGWLTAGVLALGLNGFYHDGGAAWAHRIVDQVAGRPVALVSLASERVDRFIEQTNLVAARKETGSCRVATAMARFQTRIARTQNRMASFEVMSVRPEAELARLEANRARIEEQAARVRFAPAVFERETEPEIHIVCPRVWVNVPRVSIPQPPVVRVPVVHVETLGAGPV